MEGSRVAIALQDFATSFLYVWVTAVWSPLRTPPFLICLPLPDSVHCLLSFTEVVTLSTPHPREGNGPALARNVGSRIGLVHLQYPLCLKLMESKRVDVAPMITHRFGFSENEVHAAFDCAARAAQTGAIKVMFTMVPEEELD
jgi:hypothetical protein